MLPLLAVTRTWPSRPTSSTEPERVPTTTSQPVGQRTFTESERASTDATGPSLWSLARPESITMSERSSASTRTLPDRVVTRSSWGIAIAAPDATAGVSGVGRS